jgi:hypothetical protein
MPKFALHNRGWSGRGVSEGVRRFGAKSKTSLVHVFRTKFARTLFRYLRTPCVARVTKLFITTTIMLFPRCKRLHDGI